jgi:hypothetical protein
VRFFVFGAYFLSRGGIGGLLELLLDAWMHVLLLHVMLLSQSLDNLEGKRKMSKRCGVYQN